MSEIEELQEDGAGAPISEYDGDEALKRINPVSYQYKYGVDDQRSFLMQIDYPGNVVNIDKAIETLGGIADISDCFCKEKQRLLLNFKPQNIFSKGAFGDATPSTGLLLKVKVRRRRDEVKTESTLVGKVSHCYQFRSLCDFQMLPIMKRTEESKQAEWLYDEYVPNNMENPTWIEELTSVPYFFPPTVMSRFETTNEKLFKRVGADTAVRLKRGHGEAHIVYFNLTDPFPESATELSLGLLKKTSVTKEELDTVTALFDARPLWSRQAIVASAPNIRTEKMRAILKCIAYNFTTGPWRTLWARFGYDPRKHFESRIYQTMDFRLMRKMWLNKYVAVRGNRSSRQINSQFRRHPVSSQVYRDEASTQAVEKEPASVTFEMGKFPHARLVCYQYCDIHVPRIQEMLSKVPPGGKCNEKSGWLPLDFDQICREIMLDIIKEHFREELQKKNENPQDDDEEEDEAEATLTDEENDNMMEVD